MKPIDGRRPYRALAILVAGLVVLGCVDERRIFVERELFEDPPAGAGGFLGYSSQEAKLTVCGNCHIGKQSEWRQTAHAHAWQTLQESGAARDLCIGCHTVNQRGNVANGTLGYLATGADRYLDVQCESCHGPGLSHVQLPDRVADHPQAFFAVAEGMQEGCAGCHSGERRPFAEEWAASAHGQVTAAVAGRDPVQYAVCFSCHEGTAALNRLASSKVNYVEKGDGNVYPITCTVCHDPHGSPFTAQLRMAADAHNPAENLCIQCHDRGAVADPTSPRGPHSVQGPMVLGVAELGWRPPGFVFDSAAVFGTHATDRNPRLCAGCHMNRFTQTYPDGEFAFAVTGHSFQAIPCVDEDGRPTGASDCAITARSFNSCAVGGCHGSPAAVRAATVTLESRLRAHTDDLLRLLTLVPPEELQPSPVLTVAKGARWNALLLDSDGSRGVHNPFLLELLLVSSIDAVKKEYGVE